MEISASTCRSTAKRAMNGALFTAVAVLLPVAAFAHDEAPQPLPEETLAAQRLSLGAIAAVVLVGVGFYLFRRWQTVRGGNTVYGNTRDE